jgi:hypothetical protein
VHLLGDFLPWPDGRRVVLDLLEGDALSVGARMSAQSSESSTVQSSMAP